MSKIVSCGIFIVTFATVRFWLCLDYLCKADDPEYVIMYLNVTQLIRNDEIYQVKHCTAFKCWKLSEMYYGFYDHVGGI